MRSCSCPLPTFDAVVSPQWMADQRAMSSAAHVRQQWRRLDGKRALGMVPETMKTFLKESDVPTP